MATEKELENVINLAANIIVNAVAVGVYRGKSYDHDYNRKLLQQSVTELFDIIKKGIQDGQ